MRKTLIALACALGFSGLANAQSVNSGNNQSIGSWTPADASGAGLVFTGVSAAYTKTGNMVCVYGVWTYPSTANGSAASISGLPFAPANQNYASVVGSMSVNLAYNTAYALLTKNSTTFAVEAFAAGTKTNASMSGTAIVVNFCYPVS